MIRPKKYQYFGVTEMVWINMQRSTLESTAVSTPPPAPPGGGGDQESSGRTGEGGELDFNATLTRGQYHGRRDLGWAGEGVKTANLCNNQLFKI